MPVMCLATRIVPDTMVFAVQGKRGGHLAFLSSHRFALPLYSHCPQLNLSQTYITVGSSQ